MTENQSLLNLLKELLTGVVKELGILEGRTQGKPYGRSLRYRRAIPFQEIRQEI